MQQRILKLLSKEFLLSPIFITFLVSILISLIVLFAGQNISPSLESLSLRLIVGFVVLSCGVIIVLLIKLYDKSHKDLDTQKVEIENKKRQKEITQSIEKIGKDIKNRFLQALKIIKNSSVYNKKSDANYELPWYLIMGQEKEGKTSLIEYSGLDFPLNINYQNKKLEEASDSKTFEWYFSENAIFIDTPGKYLNSKSESIDEGVWQYFLKLFKQKRWKRPINGVILTISIDTLLTKTDQEIETYAKELRERFDQISETFMSNIPIYLFITHSDKIKGFLEYFDSIEEDEKDEVLGFTFDSAIKISLEQLDIEFEELLKRIDATVIEKIHLQWDNDHRTKILLFCDELNVVFTKLKKFIEVGFAQTRYRTPLLLRGLYFTTVPQYLTPVYQENILENPTPSNKGVRGWFTKKVLEEIVFVESNLIKMDSRHKSKEKRREVFAIASSVFIVLLAIGFWLFDYIEHKNTISKISNELVEFSNYYNNTPNLYDFDERLALLNKLYEIKEIETSDAQKFWKLSFYKIKERQSRLDKLYYTTIEQFLLNDIKKILENNTMNNLNNYDITWENLKAYIMFNKIDSREKEFLISWINEIVEKNLPHNEQQKKQIQQHWSNLVNFGFSQTQLNDTIVTKARYKLSEFGQELILYKQLKDKILAEELKDFQFSNILNTQNKVFAGTEHIIPSFYTKVGYYKVMSVNSKTILSQLQNYSWVLGEVNNFTQEEINEIYQKMQMLYFEEYKASWMNALNNLYIADVKNEDQIEEQFKLFVSSNSPVIQILQALKENTLIYSDSELMLLSSQKENNSIEKDLSIEAKGTKYLRDSFAIFHQLLDDDGQPSTILSNEIKKLETVSLQTLALGSSGSGADALNSIKSRVSGDSNPISVSLSPLPKPVSNWFVKSLHNNWKKVMTQAKSQINEQYASKVYAFYIDKLANKYPLNNKSTTEISLTDFEEFFRKNGILDKFYEEYLSYFVKINPRTNQYQLRKIDGVTLQIDKQIVEAIILGQDIRKRFFTGSSNKLHSVFFIKPHFLSKNYSALSLNYDQDTLLYEHGPIRTKKLIWPISSGNIDSTFSVANISQEQEISIRNDGDWSLFRLFNDFKVIDNGTNSIIVEYSQNNNKVSFQIDGSGVKGFETNNPMRKFRLKESI